MCGCYGCFTQVMFGYLIIRDEFYLQMFIMSFVMCCVSEVILYDFLMVILMTDTFKNTFG